MSRCVMPRPVLYDSCSFNARGACVDTMAYDSKLGERDDT